MQEPWLHEKYSESFAMTGRSKVQQMTIPTHHRNSPHDTTAGTGACDGASMMALKSGGDEVVSAQPGNSETKAFAIRHYAGRYPHLIFAGMIIALAGAVYLPFLGNPMIFDDLTLFSGSGFAHYASTPIGTLRGLPNFSLAFTQIMWGKFPPWYHAELHRIISLALHIACALALYKLLYDLLRSTVTGPAPGAKLVTDARVSAGVPAFIGAAIFAIHPVAVYGAAYLVERTIVMATLFSLLSVICYMRGLARGNRTDALTAAFFYTLAIFSKEHSVLLPLAAVMITPLLAKDSRFARRYAAGYLLACLPAAVTVIVLMRWVVGATYEPYYAMLLAEKAGIPDLGIPGGAWLVSVVTQSGLFFRYLAAWLVPNTAAMSIDIRIDFMQGWSFGWILLKLVALGAFGILGLMLLFRRGKTGLAGFGFLYFLILFLVELSTARFQFAYSDARRCSSIAGCQRPARWWLCRRSRRSDQ